MYPQYHNPYGISAVYPFLHGSRLYPADRPSYNDSNKAYFCHAYRCGLQMYKILGKTTVMGLCDIHNSNSNKKNKKKTKNKMYTPHHTISHTHTHTPKDGKQVKTDENSSPACRLWYTLRERPRQRHDTARQSRKTRSRTSTHTSPSCFHFTYFSAYTGWREHGTIQPV